METHPSPMLVLLVCMLLKCLLLWAERVGLTIRALALPIIRWPHPSPTPPPTRNSMVLVWPTATKHSAKRMYLKFQAVYGNQLVQHFRTEYELHMSTAGKSAVVHTCILQSYCELCILQAYCEPFILQSYCEPCILQSYCEPESAWDALIFRWWLWRWS